ncbi:MAG: hypothetical protein LBU23_12980, partial [Planctomycetota bacterium]|nr:hypothetical protein [Planctomycetota bacterium]
MAVHLKGESPRPQASMTPTGAPVSSSDGVGPIGETAKATGEADAPQGLPPQAERSEKAKMIITVGDVTLTAIMADNSSAEAFMTLLRSKPLTIKMHDYGCFEKVGPIGQTLPRNDEPTNATAGDLILYQGGSFVIYYGE